MSILTLSEILIFKFGIVPTVWYFLLFILYVRRVNTYFLQISLLLFSNPYFIRGAYFGEGSLRVWLDQLSCNGTEDDIGECGSRGWGASQCGHSKDVSVICGKLIIITSNIWYTVVCDTMVSFISM